LIGKTVYLPKHTAQIVIAPPKSEIHQLIGYTIIDRIKGEIGIIEAIEDTTENILFVISYKNTELLIPVVEKFIEKIDDRRKAIITQLPVGLLELNRKE
jgi:16S rRNA processing protein RimM